MASSLLANLLVDATHLPLGAATTVLAMTSLFHWPPQAKVSDGDYFDFIVIGSGGGAVVANRLTENKDVKVLLVEAGKNPSVESMLPGLFVLLQNSYQDWNYESEPEYTTRNQQNGTYKMSAGKCLGGSGGINHFLHLRGDKQDFDSWAEYLQDDSWSYDNVLKYFKKSEKMTDKASLNVYPEYYGTTGPVIITKDHDDSNHKLLRAFEEAGIPWVTDLNANSTIGYTESPFIIGNGVRQSPAQSYLNNLKRTNLYVLTETVAEKILFENKAAKGVVLKDSSGKKFNVYANKEIILSAGTYNSAKILLLSGIGPAEDLEELGIEVIQDLPVGKEMQDHHAVFLVNKLERSLEISQLPRLTKIPFEVLLGGAAVDQSSYAEYQNIALKFTHDTVYLVLLCSVFFGYKHDICSRLNRETTGRNHLATFIGSLHPESRGYVKLRSADPDDDPLLSQSFYSNPQDFTNMEKYLADFFKVYNSSYFQEIGAEVADPGLEGCGEMTFENKDYWRCYISNFTSQLFHPTSSCAMGTVTTPRLLVQGVSNLRVVDASVMPNITRANTHAATLMIAEKASDMIKEDHGLETTTEQVETTTVAEEESGNESIIDKVLDVIG